MIIKIFTDGGSLNNPGQAAYAFIIYKDGELIHSEGKPIGIATNNIAEYTGLIKALEKVKQILLTSNFSPLTSITFYSDSSLMVNQLNGLFKVKNAKIREMVFMIRSLESEINTSIKYIHIPREKNMLADSLVKRVLKKYHY